MIVALILIDVCFLLAHLCEGIDWMFYPLVIIITFCTGVAFDSYENLKKRIEKLEKKGGEG
jgi:hypothetical protein